MKTEFNNPSQKLYDLLLTGKDSLTPGAPLLDDDAVFQRTQELLAQGANADSVFAEGTTLLMLAGSRLYAQTMGLLIDNGASLTKTDVYGRSVFHAIAGARPPAMSDEAALTSHRETMLLLAASTLERWEEQITAANDPRYNHISRWIEDCSDSGEKENLRLIRDGNFEVHAIARRPGSATSHLRALPASTPGCAALNTPQLAITD